MFCIPIHITYIYTVHSLENLSEHKHTNLWCQNWFCFCSFSWLPHSFKLSKFESREKTLQKTRKCEVFCPQSRKKIIAWNLDAGKSQLRRNLELGSNTRHRLLRKSTDSPGFSQSWMVSYVEESISAHPSYSFPSSCGCSYLWKHATHKPMLRKSVSCSELDFSQKCVAKAMIWQINVAATNITTMQNKQVNVNPFILLFESEEVSFWRQEVAWTAQCTDCCTSHTSYTSNTSQSTAMCVLNLAWKESTYGLVLLLKCVYTVRRWNFGQSFQKVKPLPQLYDHGS